MFITDVIVGAGVLLQRIILRRLSNVLVTLFRINEQNKTFHLFNHLHQSGLHGRLKGIWQPIWSLPNRVWKHEENNCHLGRSGICSSSSLDHPGGKAVSCYVGHFQKQRQGDLSELRNSWAKYSVWRKPTPECMIPETGATCYLSEQ